MRMKIVNEKTLASRSRSFRRVLKPIAFLALGCWASFTSAELTLKPLDTPRDFEHAPSGAQCWTLGPEGKAGLPENFDPGAPTAKLFCPECLADPAYAADLPLRRIEQRLLQPAGVTGDNSCEGDCQRWLLRPEPSQDAALMVVRVGVATLCGATGWCPGRIYERRNGEWQLAGSFGANEANELCLWPPGKGRLQLWLTPMADPAETLEMEWVPRTGRDR